MMSSCIYRPYALTGGSKSAASCVLSLLSTDDVVIQWQSERMTPYICPHMLTSLLTPPTQWHFQSTGLWCCVTSPSHQTYEGITSALAMFPQTYGRYILWRYICRAYCALLYSCCLSVTDRSHPEAWWRSSFQTHGQTKAALFNLTKYVVCELCKPVCYCATVACMIK